MTAKSSSPRRSRRGVRAMAMCGRRYGDQGLGTRGWGSPESPVPSPQSLLCYGVMPRSPDRVVIRNARQHNLRGVTVELPRGALTVVTGPSGSRSEERRVGKSVDLGGRRVIKTKTRHEWYDT